MRIKRYFFISLCLVLSMNSCKDKKDDPGPENELVCNLPLDAFEMSNQDNLSAADYDIYSLVLQEYFSGQTSYLVKQPTFTTVLAGSSPFKDELIAAVSGIDSSSIQDFASKNTVSYNLGNNFSVAGKQTALIGQAELAAIFDEPGHADPDHDWKEFHNQYPANSGYISFSRIGYNTSGDQAVLETGYQFGSLGGEWSVIYLVKENGQWRIVYTKHTMMS